MTTLVCSCGTRLDAPDEDGLLAALREHSGSTHAGDPMYSEMELQGLIARASDPPPRAAGGIDRLIVDLRTFMLTYGEHDSECPGRDATGPEAITETSCTCGFIGRMNALLAEVAERINGPEAKP